MNTLSYAKYSDGVKTHVNAKKLFKTRQRSILGAFVVASSKTTIDPNALLMRKDNSRIFNVDEADVLLMQSTRGYTRDKVIAYYEAVTQIPQASKNLAAYTNLKHDPPGTIEPREMTKLPEIIWYANSWTGNSWVQHLVKNDGGVPCFWTKDHTEISDPFSKAWRIYDAKFPMRGWRITYDVHKTKDHVFEQLLKFLEKYADEPVVHVWIQGTLQGRNPKQTVNDLRNMITSESASYADGEVSNNMIPRGIQKTAEYMSLWETPLSETQDLWEAYGGRAPMRIPIIPWRVSNLGPRAFHKGIPPQLFPSSTIKTIMGMDKSDLQFTEVYCNYSSFVEMTQLTENDVKLLDYGWMPVGANLFTMAPITEDNYTHLLKVKDPDFFRGCGSVVTSSHACFGLGRTNDELLFQHERKVQTGHGTSGHMIASVLAFQSQFLWYLQEVFDNYTSNKSVYIAKFREPESGVYHTIHEYRNAIHDMKRIDSNKLYPKYARNNFEICKKFVNLLKV
uniref:VP7 n=1 Tax=viral metagenome TaxID=1070528 RepID=A0A2V0RIY0_9ZZZZ